MLVYLYISLTHPHQDEVEGDVGKEKKDLKKTLAGSLHIQTYVPYDKDHA